MRYKLETHLKGQRKVTRPFTVFSTREIQVGDTIIPKCEEWVVDSVVELLGTKVQFGDTLI